MRLQTAPAVSLILLAALSCWSGQAQSQSSTSPASAPPPAYASNPKYQAAMAEGAQMMRERRYDFAAIAFKKANKVAGGACADCLFSAYSMEMKTANYKEAATLAESLTGLMTTPSGKSSAEYRQAYALFLAAGDKPKPDKLEAVHRVLQQALHETPHNAPVLYLDGQVLAGMGKMDEAKNEFTECVSCVNPKDPARLRAEHFAADPELSLHKMAPPFEVTALDGSRFNLDAMGGRVVLIDFWATWCGPCNRELPHMKKIAKEFAGDPLVIISVSWDKDEDTWKSFIAKNEMTWMQYRDADHKLSDMFGINAIPHYFTIDSDGVLTAEMLGEDSDVEGKLKKLIAKARAAKKESVAILRSPQQTDATLQLATTEHSAFRD